MKQTVLICVLASIALPLHTCMKQSNEQLLAPVQQTTMQALPFDARIYPEQAMLEYLMRYVPPHGTKKYEQRKNELLRFLKQNAQLPKKMRVHNSRIMTQWSSHTPAILTAMRAFNSDPDIVRSLLSHHADIYARDEVGNNALNYGEKVISTALAAIMRDMLLPTNVPLDVVLIITNYAINTRVPAGQTMLHNLL